MSINKIHTFLSFLLLLVIAIPLQAQEKHFYVISGSFATSDAAEQMVAKLRTQNYQPQVISPDKKSDSYRVSIYDSKSRDEVDAFVANQKRLGRPAGWVLAAEPPRQIQTRGLGAPTGSASLDDNAQVYHLVAGSFNTYDLANQALSGLEDKGYEPYIIFPKAGSNSYRVGIFYSNDREEVETYNKMLKKRGEKGGWILTEEPQKKQQASSQISTRGLTMAPAEAKNGSAGNVTYHLISGSFDRFDQAKQAANELEKQGYSPTILFPVTGKAETFRISLYRSTNKVEVEGYKETLDQAGKKSGWIYAEK